MSQEKIIQLLYKNATSIPDPIIQDALTKVPAGFALRVCDQSLPDAERRAIAAEAEYVIAYSVPLPDYDMMRSVKLVQLLSAGFDTLDMNTLKEMEIPVANNGSANATTVAEHAVLLILSLLKKLPLHHQALQQGEWLGHRHALGLRELKGKRIGILGFGHIGQDVARCLSGFRPDLVYFDARGTIAGVEEELGARYLPFDELIATADIISVHLPLFESTRGLIGKKQFAAMKNSAFIINTSRGPVIDEGALIDALDGGEIAGAGLDVFSAEPLAKDSLLLGRENVIVTPHIAGTAIDNWYRRIEFSFANIVRVENGQEPLARVDQ